jgi:solute:Na+ symporter, SSS family
MSCVDWLILIVTLAGIVCYGIWKSRNTKNINGYFLADKQLPWYHVALSVMATQASAITFLSAPGQGFTDGLRFVQFYFGLPLAMVVLCITFIPIFRKLNVYTAYEFLEKRFDNKTRTLTAALFLLQRGLSTGITIYAPAIILSTLLAINITYMIVLNGILVITYTVYGGTRAVSYTQMLQMAIIFSGLFLAFYLLVDLLPQDISFSDAMHITGKMGKLNAIDTSFDINNRYNIWSGLIGGFFLQLSYFGTDQSQVGRYLTGSSDRESRMGLLFNAIIKIPMQFFILLTGVMVFCFYQFYEPPLFFNVVETSRLENGIQQARLDSLRTEHHANFTEQRGYVEVLVKGIREKNESLINKAKENIATTTKRSQEIGIEVKKLMKDNDSKADTNDGNYIFLYFVMHHLPKGVVGLLIAIIFLAAMGSTASGLNSLASTSVVDFYKRIFHKDSEERNYLSASRWFTVGWGAFCILVAMYASKLGNLIEAVNILGSLFYGTILGIFLVAFYMKKTGASAVFIAAIITEIAVIVIYLMGFAAFLWLNVIGCLLVMVLSFIFEAMISRAASRRLRP